MLLWYPKLSKGVAQRSLQSIYVIGRRLKFINKHCRTALLINTQRFIHPIEFHWPIFFVQKKIALSRPESWLFKATGPDGVILLLQGGGTLEIFTLHTESDGFRRWWRIRGRGAARWKALGT